MRWQPDSSGPSPHRPLDASMEHMTGVRALRLRDCISVRSGDMLWQHRPHWPGTHITPLYAVPLYGGHSRLQAPPQADYIVPLVVHLLGGGNAESAFPAQDVEAVLRGWHGDWGPLLLPVWQ